MLNMTDLTLAHTPLADEVSMKIIDANKQFSKEIFQQAILEARAGDKLKWRMAPDQAFVAAQFTISVILSKEEDKNTTFPRIFADMMLDIPIEIEWDFLPNTIQLRDQSRAIVQIENLPNATL